MQVRKAREEARGALPAEAPDVAALGPSLAKAAMFSTVGLFVIAMLWCAYVARPVIVPVVLAWVIATIVLPLVTWLSERGIPRVVAAIMVTVLLVLCIVSLLLLLSTPLAYWIGRASEVGALLKTKLQSMNQPIALLQEIQRSLSVIGTESPVVRVEAQSGSVIETIFSTLTPAVSQAMLFIGALTFYLVYQQRIRTAIVFFLEERETRLSMLRKLKDIDENMTVYFGTFTAVNLCLAVATIALTWVVGLPNPLLWGVLAGVLNYVPYLGPGIVVGTLSVVSFMTFSSLTEALVAPAVFLGMVTVEGQFITPALMGRRLELNPFAVFLAIAFCTWLWGPIGAFLAVPLLMAFTLFVADFVSEPAPDLPD